MADDGASKPLTVDGRPAIESDFDQRELFQQEIAAERAVQMHEQARAESAARP